MMPYQVKVDVFEGPFDLLLYLIKKNELDIYTVSLAQITSQYLDFIKTMQEMDLELAGDFLVIAATLIYIKTQRLLPQPQTPEELEELEQTEEQLLQKLQEYQKYKLLGDQLWELAEARQLLFTKGESLPPLENPEDIPVNCTLNDLVIAYQKYARFATPSPIREVEMDKYTIELKIDFFNQLMQQHELVHFSALRKKMKHRIELVVTLLAMLELCRLKQMSLRQMLLFGEILITKYQLPQINYETTVSDSPPKLSPEITKDNPSDSPSSSGDTGDELESNPVEET